jgi:hypothetical protein
MINDNFLNGMAGLLIGESVTIPSYLAFGSTTGTLTAQDTITSGEFDRNIYTTTERIGNVSKYSFLRTGGEVATSSGQYINVIGLMNSSAGGSLWANTLVSSLLHTTAFDLDIELWFTISRN